MSHLEVFGFTGGVFGHVWVTLLAHVGEFNPIGAGLLLQMAAAALHLGHAAKGMAERGEQGHIWVKNRWCKVWQLVLLLFMWKGVSVGTLLKRKDVLWEEADCLCDMFSTVSLLIYLAVCPDNFFKPVGNFNQACLRAQRLQGCILACFVTAGGWGVWWKGEVRLWILWEPAIPVYPCTCFPKSTGMAHGRKIRTLSCGTPGDNGKQWRYQGKWQWETAECIASKGKLKTREEKYYRAGSCWEKIG